MLAIAKKLVAYTKRSGLAHAAVGAVTRWDLGEVEGKLRSLVIRLEDEGREELATELEKILDQLEDSTDILMSEKNYLQRLVVELEDAMILQGVPIDDAHEISIAFDAVSGVLRDLVHDPSVLARAQADPVVSRLYDEATETLHALKLAIDPWIDVGETSPGLEAYVEGVLAEHVDSREADEAADFGFEVISLDEFVEMFEGEAEPDFEHFMPHAEEELNDLAVDIQAGFAKLDDVMTELSNLIPQDVGIHVESAIDNLYDSIDDLEELVLN